AVSVSSAPLAAYRDKRWVTRPRPHVDRLSCIWLIRRFINPQAVVRYSPTPEPGEVAFDMPHGEFTHRGHLCTFETMVHAFSLEDPSLQPMGEIIHEIDLRDGCYVHPETAGVDAVLKGWLLAGLSDPELEAHGVALFEGLYADLSRRNRQAPRKRRGGAGDSEHA
ncbi:MAG: chromate resistance protein, partial [Actinomycetota bacterium]|nr:chromate resistance protein [Actinomycetota bacterium]